MATTTVTQLTNAWANIVTDGSDYVIQNTGSNPIFLVWKATAPAATATGFVIAPGAGADTATFFAGPIWARCPAGSGQVSVNQ